MSKELIERLRVFAGDPVLGGVIEEAADRIEELERENNELLADAMRYRWIKEQSDGKPFYFHAIRHKHAENLDAAIDAALAKVRKP